MNDWDAATWAQVVIAAVGLVVAPAATAVAWWTYRFTIISQPIEVFLRRATRPSPVGTVPMVIECASPNAYVHQIWSPSWTGGDADSVPDVVGVDAQKLVGGDIRGFTVIIPDGVTAFDLTVTASVTSRTAARNVPTPMPTFSVVPADLA